jgi:uncharacterized membrane protein YqjE
MVLAESVTRLAATLIAVIQTRTELIATELEEESLRYFSSLMLALAGMFCVGVAVVLGVMLIVVLYWDTHRVGTLLTLAILFALAGVFIGMRMRSQYRAKPKLLGHTVAELSRDADLLQPRA